MKKKIKELIQKDRYATLDIPTKYGSINLKIPEYAIDAIIQGVQTMVEDEESARARGSLIAMKAPGKVSYITIAYLGGFAETKYDHSLIEPKK